MGGGPIIIIDPADGPEAAASGKAHVLSKRLSDKARKPKKYRYRSAVTGRYVTAAYAKRYPHLTVRERA